VAALILSTGAAAIAADAEDRNGSGSGPRPTASGADGPAPPRRVFVVRRGDPARGAHTISASESLSVAAQPTMLLGASDDPGDGSRPETTSELRDWIKDNATLVSNASLLISLAMIALSLLPDVGFFAPYIRALLFAAALLLLTELHHQWPEDLHLHRLRTHARTQNNSWRMIGFALVLQVATLLFATWAILTNPIILLPLTALAVFLAFYRWVFRRYEGVLVRIAGINALLVVLLLSELVTVVVWAAVISERVTTEL